MIIRPVILEKEKARLLYKTEIQMLGRLMGISLRERKRVGVRDITEKIREAHLCLVQHMLMTRERDVNRQFFEKDTVGRRKGRPKLRWKEVMERDMREMGVQRVYSG